LSRYCLGRPGDGVPLAPSTEKLEAAKLIKEAQNVRRTRPDGEPIALPSTDAMQAGAADLLLNQPELFVDRLALATKDGDLKISARAKLVDIATEDVKPSINFGRLTNKVMATADISVSQSLIDHWPGAEANTANIKKMISEFDRSGYLVRKGDRLETHFEFSKGALTANGKAVGK